MLKALLVIFLVLAGAVGAVVAFAAVTQPNEFEVTRSRAINASPEQIFPLIDDLHRMNEWNPFAKGDPDMRIDYSGSQSGKGAAHAWHGGKSGEGRLEIIESAPPSRVAMRLDMTKPIQGHNDILFTLKPAGHGTEVTWSMRGDLPLVSKVIGLFVSMDRMIGGQFEKGLADLEVMALNARA